MPSSYETLESWLEMTHDQELDCDRFAELIAPWLDRCISDPRLLELLERHRKLCIECDEEVRLVSAALSEEA